VKPVLEPPDIALDVGDRALLGKGGQGDGGGQCGGNEGTDMRWRNSLLERSCFRIRFPNNLFASVIPVQEVRDRPWRNFGLTIL
jgi:hypothetical protein